MKEDLCYTASDCFESFPFPTSAAQATLESIGGYLYAVRAYYMAVTWQGLTTTYNQLKDPDYAGDLLPASAARPASPNRSSPPWIIPSGLVDEVRSIATDPDLLQSETRVAYIRYIRRLHEDLDRAVLAAYGWSEIVVPPYCPPRSTDLVGQVAVSLFEDNIIDRLFALNAERAAAESIDAVGRTPAIKSARARAKPKAKRKSSAQISFLGDD